jgi:hypothetical protein
VTRAARCAAVLLLAVGVLVGCSENRIRQIPPPPVAEPPKGGEDFFGNTPDFNTCTTGYLGQYFNLRADSPDVENEEPAGEDHWAAGGLAYQQHDGSLEFGPQWWPVDEGLPSDPSYFAVRWTAWLRAYSDTEVVFALGAKDDAQLHVGGELAYEISGAEAFVVEEVRVEVDAGLEQVDLRFAHRFGDEDGFSFRLVAGDAIVCPPDFDDD